MESVEKEYQLTINRMSRGSLTVFQATPVGIIMAERGFRRARALLDPRR